MEAVLIIKYSDGSKGMYGHIDSSLSVGSDVSRGTLLGMVRVPTERFASHFHYGEWQPPKDKSVQEKRDFETACLYPALGSWGWGRAPLGTSVDQVLKCGWIDVAAKYGWNSEIPATQPVAFVGQFSNMRYTEEHMYGSGLSLWSTGFGHIGYFGHAEGLLGVFPKGVVKDVFYNPMSGVIRFQAKLSMGEHNCAVHRGVRSEDVFAFNGKLKGRQLTGDIRQLDALHENRLVASERVTLNRVEDAGMESKLRNYAEVRNWLESIGVPIRP